MRAHPRGAIGNVRKSEMLVAGIDPFAQVEVLGKSEVERVLGVARGFVDGERSRAVADAQGGNRPTFRVSIHHAKLCVYGRSGNPCPTCGTLIQARKSSVD